MPFKIFIYLIISFGPRSFDTPKQFSFLIWRGILGVSGTSGSGKASKGYGVQHNFGRLYNDDFDYSTRDQHVQFWSREARTDLLHSGRGSAETWSLELGALQRLVLAVWCPQ